MREAAVIFLNGVRREVRGGDAMMMLADWLRGEEGLPGTKVVCAEGDCGACTVLRSFRGSGFDAVNACITTVAQMDGSHLVTVEGLERSGELAPAQEAMMKCHASQCGYCTPGFVMALTAMRERHATPSRTTVANYLTGNLCRCTGYEQILDAGCAMVAPKSHSLAERYRDAASVDVCNQVTSQPLSIVAPSIRFHAPTTLRAALALMASEDGCRVLAGGTDLGVPVNKGAAWAQTLLSLHLIPDLDLVEVGRRRVTVGANATLSCVRRACEGAVPEFARFLNLFASPQIKNTATLAGNVANASPIGDTLPFLFVAGGTLHLARRAPEHGRIERRELSIDQAFSGYRRLALQPGELITHVSFDATRKGETLRLFKVSQRKDLDISAVSAAFAITRVGNRSGEYPVIDGARVAYGGIAATPVRLAQVEDALRGELTPAKVASVASLITHAIAPISDLRGSSAYRRIVAANLFRRFADEVMRG